MTLPRDGERDLVGYAGAPPYATWPDDARVALNFALNIEEGAEYGPLDGDARSDLALTEAPGMDTGVPGRDLAAESMFEYGSRVGVWRLLRLFDSRALPLTVFACALALERNPPLAQALSRSSHDLCSHGWRWEKHFLLDEETEREHIRRAVLSFESTLGRRPAGWCCRYGPSTRTRRLLAEHGGFLYDSDAYNDDLPYWVAVDGEPRLVVPYSLVTNDCKLSPIELAAPGALFELLRDGLDWLVEEGRERPAMMSVGLHPRMIGHPSRITALARFLDHARATPGVWICRREDIARHWMHHHPPT